MALLRGTLGLGPLMVAALALAALSSCGGGGGSGSGTPPSVAEPAPVPGATRVTGSERMVWFQAGDLSSLRFLAYVDGNATWLDATTCNAEADCSSPLPPLTDGVHTLAVGAVSAISGLEGPRSETLTVQKFSARSVVSASGSVVLGRSSAYPGAGALVTTPDGREFTVDVVAQSLTAPVQMAPTPDGRLLIAEADGRVGLRHPDEPGRTGPVFETRVRLDPPPVGPMGIAVHPDFADNQFVYVSFLALDAPEQPRLRVVRLREAGGSLGEAATLFEAPVVASGSSAGPSDAATPGVADRLSAAGPRLAFGPDALIYALLPPGFELDAEPAASRPRASMLRLADDGRVPDAGPLSGIVSHPLGFGWHPLTDGLWGIVSGREGEAEVRALGAVSAMETGRVVLGATAGPTPSSGTLTIEQPDAGMQALARAFVEAADRRASGAVRLAVPVQAEGLVPGLPGLILDVVSDGAGAIFFAMSDGRAEAPAGGSSGMVVRLKPR